MAVSQLMRAIRKVAEKGLNAYEYIRGHEEVRYYNKLTIDLGEARDKEEYHIFGEGFYVESNDGECEIYLNEKGYQELDLFRGRKCFTDFWRFFLTNEAQAGKTIVLIIYKEGAFDILDTDYWLNLLQDGQDTLARESGGILDAIQGAMATASRQDYLELAIGYVEEAIGYVQDGTNKIVSGGATALKQDTIIDGIGKMYILTLSDVIQLEDNTTHSSASQTWAKAMQFTMLSSGTIRIKAQIKATSPTTCLAQVRVNAIDRGDQWETAETTYQDVSMDIGVGIGDFVQIWWKTEQDGINAWLRFGKICCDQSLGVSSIGVVE